MNSLTLPRWFGRRKKPKKKEEAILKANGQHPVHTPGPLASLTPPLATSRLFEHDVDSVGGDADQDLENGLHVGSLRKDYCYNSSSNTFESSRRPKSAFILDDRVYSQGVDLLGYNVYENLQFSTLTTLPRLSQPRLPQPHQTSSHRQLPTRFEDLNVNDLKYIQQQDEDGGRYRPQTTSTPLGPSESTSTSMSNNRLDNQSMDFLVASSKDFFEEEDDIYQVCGRGDAIADPHSMEDYQQEDIGGCFNDFRSYVLWDIMERSLLLADVCKVYELEKLNLAPNI